MTKIGNMLQHLLMRFTRSQLVTLEKFVVLLSQWNRTYNLVGTQDVKQIITKHIADSLAINRYIHGQRIVDVGTGAGFPGIPLAVVQPRKQFVLIDSNEKNPFY